MSTKDNFNPSNRLDEWIRKLQKRRYMNKMGFGYPHQQYSIIEEDMIKEYEPDEIGGL